MRFQSAILAFMSTIAVVSALNVFTVPEIDLTSAGMLNRSKIPAPQPPARFRQATRADIIARQKRGPARRQISTASICNRPITGETNYAVFTNAFITTDNPIIQGFAATVEECYAYCEQTAECVAVTHDGLPGDEAGACTPQDKIELITGAFGTQVVSEIKGYTCAEFKAEYPNAENYNCCDALRQ